MRRTTISIISIILFTIGFVLLGFGAEVMVRGSSRLAVNIGITPLVVGLTVVAFGTSSPEIAVSVMAAYSGPNGSDIALGNIVGSNIFNVFFILGLSALVTPLIVSIQLLRFDVPVMIGVSILMLLLALDGSFERLDGILLFSGVIVYTIFVIQQSRKQVKRKKTDYDKEYGKATDGKSQVMLDVIFIVIGIAMLVLGSHWLVQGAIDIAKYLGISELVISLTIVSVGTSMPEVATSVMASIKGERDIAVGNIIGSNLFNILAVLGLCAIVSPGDIQVPRSILTFDLPVMLAAMFICLPIFFAGFRIIRLEGFILLSCYAIYITYVVLAATGNQYLPQFTTAMVYFVIPLILLTLTVLAYKQIKTSKA